MVDRDLSLGDLQQVVLDASKVGAETVQRLELAADALGESAHCFVLNVSVKSTNQSINQSMKQPQSFLKTTTTN